MEIWQLNTFSVVAKTLHFTRAAEELNLTQSAVSHQIKSLEEELKIVLFHRNKRQISLTTKGKTVLQYADKILNQVKVLRNEIEEGKETLQGTLKLVANPRSLNSPFYLVKRDFESVYPNIELFFESVLTTDAIFENVRKGLSDVGFTTENEDFRDLVAIPFGNFEMLFVVGKNHPLASKNEVNLNDLENENWFLFEEGSWLRKQTDKLFLQNKFNPNKVSVTNDGSTVFLAIAEGMGVGFLPKWGILQGLEDGKIVPVKIKGIKFNVPLHLIISPTNHSKLISAFVDYLLKKRVEGIEPSQKN